MRTSSPAGPDLRMQRVFRPWVIATVLGSALGAALLGVQRPEAEPFYNDPILRSAAQGSFMESTEHSEADLEIDLQSTDTDPALEAEATPFAPEPPR